MISRNGIGEELIRPRNPAQHLWRTCKEGFQAARFGLLRRCIRAIVKLNGTSRTRVSGLYK